MIRILLATLHAATSCQPHHGLGTSALLGFEGAYWFSGGKSANTDIDAAMTGCLNLVELTKSGRCRATLTPT